MRGGNRSWLYWHLHSSIRPLKFLIQNYIRLELGHFRVRPLDFLVQNVGPFTTLHLILPGYLSTHACTGNGRVDGKFDGKHALDLILHLILVNLNLGTTWFYDLSTCQSSSLFSGASGWRTGAYLTFYAI